MGSPTNDGLSSPRSLLLAIAAAYSIYVFLSCAFYYSLSNFFKSYFNFNFYYSTAYYVFS